MVIFVDLDGTLINTADTKYKEYKDGISDFDLSVIPVFPDAVNFVNRQKEKGHDLIILSDSHPKYVSKIASEIFSLEYISLADKPNTIKTMAFIESRDSIKELFADRDNFLLIGDSVLDIEIGRKLRIRTILTSFYKNGIFDPKDGIGDNLTSIKYGPTFYAKTFSDIEKIIESPFEHLLSIEAAYINSSSDQVVKYWDYRSEERFVAIRCLARQEQGVCDKYARADLYYQIDNPERSQNDLSIMANGVMTYLKAVISNKKYCWDYITYITDKKTTSPPNKMKEIFDLVEIDIPKISIIEWKNNITSSLRAEPLYKNRRNYLKENMRICKDADLKNKNIIILDDQLTTGATAFEIKDRFIKEGVRNILFVTLFYNGLVDGIDKHSILSDSKVVSNVIGVLSGGLNYEYTSSKTTCQLASLVMENNGLLISEVEPNKKEDQFSGSKSSRIQSGLSSALILVQSSINGGSKYTIKTFCGLGRPMGVVNYSASEEFNTNDSFGANRLILIKGIAGVAEFCGYKTSKSIHVSDIVSISSINDYQKLLDRIQRLSSSRFFLN